MTISLRAETQMLIEEQMEAPGVRTPDELVRVALQTLRQVRGEDFDSLDPQTRAAIKEGLAKADRGEGRPWEERRAHIGQPQPFTVRETASPPLAAVPPLRLVSLPPPAGIRRAIGRGTA